MSQKLYFGNASAKSVSPKKMYVGVNGTSRTVNKIYVGQNNKAVQVYPYVEDVWFAPGFYMIDRPSLEVKAATSSLTPANYYLTSDVTFPYYCEDDGTSITSFNEVPALSPILNITSDTVTNMQDAVICANSDDVTVSPDSIYFNATNNFRVALDPNEHSYLKENQGIRSFLTSIIKPAIQMGDYYLNLKNLLIPQEFFTSEVESALAYLGSSSNTIYFTYYCPQHKNYVGRYIKFNINSRWDYLTNFPYGEYDSYVKPVGTLELGMYDCQEGAYKAFTYNFNDDYQNPTSGIQVEIWVPFNQSLKTQSETWPEMRYPTMFKDVSDMSKAGYWLKDRLRGVLERHELTSTISSVRLTVSQGESSWENEDFRTQLYYGLLSGREPSSGPDIEYESRTNAGKELSRFTNISSRIIRLDRAKNAIYLDWGCMAGSTYSHIGEAYSMMQDFDAEFDYAADPHATARDIKSPVYINHPSFCSMSSTAKLPVYHYGQLVCLPQGYTDTLTIYY